MRESRGAANLSIDNGLLNNVQDLIAGVELMRKESDSIGDILLPDEVYYGIQTERARMNFSISGRNCTEFDKYIWSIAAIKKAAALANRAIGMLDGAVADAICKAVDEIMAGSLEDQFPLDVFQGGGGTSSNMNVNEVIANYANELLTGHKGYDRVHPNTHVNMGQSTNDVIPASVRLACYFNLRGLIGSVRKLEAALEIKTAEFADVVKLGRTCLQDAVPITLGQEFSGYLAFVRRQIVKLDKAADACLELPLGGTAVGTGLSTFPGYLERVYTFLADITGAPVRMDSNLFDGMQTGDIYVDVSGAMVGLATGLGKFSRDLRLLSSGPRAGLNEIRLPALQPGSSIMPGKVNPVMPELMIQVCYQVYGNNLAVTMAADAGEPDLNVWEPVTLKCLLESCRLLRESIPLLTEKCVRGIEANRDVCRRYAESSIALSTVLNSIHGYQTASKVAKAAYAGNSSVKEVSVEMGLLSREEAERIIDPMLLTDPEKSGRVLMEKAKASKG